jgi:hypothetical protein
MAHQIYSTIENGLLDRTTNNGSRSGSKAGIAGLGPAAMTSQWEEDGWRQQRTPGSYECWNFDVLDSMGNGASVSFFDGLYFHPKYLREEARFYRSGSHPRLKNVRDESLASFYPAVAISLFQGGRRIAHAVNVYPPGSFRGEQGSPEIAIGPNRITLRQDGTFGLQMRAYPTDRSITGPKARLDQMMFAELTFRPKLPGVQHSQLLRPNMEDGARHTWVIAAPLCEVTGRIQQVNLRDDTLALDLPVQADGFHDHIFGGSGICRRIKRIIRGHAVGSDWAIAWNHSVGNRCDGQTDSICLFETDAQPLIIPHPQVETIQRNTSHFLVPYPAHISMHGSDLRGNAIELLVNHHDVLEAGPGLVRSTCSVQLTTRGKSRFVGMGLLETNSTRSVGLPVISDWASRSIIRIEADDPLWRL